MSQNPLSNIQDLPIEAQRRAAAFVEEGQYYGWKLRSVQTKPLGDFTQCTLDFGQERIVFLCHGGSAGHARAIGGR